MNKNIPADVNAIKVFTNNIIPPLALSINENNAP